MSNVAVASDSLQMSQQLARYSQQRWVLRKSRESRENTREKRGAREKRCVSERVRDSVCACAHAGTYGCPSKSLYHKSLYHKSLHHSQWHSRLHYLLTKEARTARNPGGGVSV